MGLMDFIKGSTCQSCGMPMRLNSDFGTEANGDKSKEYCTYCYQKGSFNEPNITMEQMIEKTAGFMSSKMMLPKQKALNRSRDMITKLKRWESNS